MSDNDYMNSNNFYAQQARTDANQARFDLQRANDELRFAQNNASDMSSIVGKLRDEVQQAHDQNEELRKLNFIALDERNYFKSLLPIEIQQETELKIKSFRNKLESDATEKRKKELRAEIDNMKVSYNTVEETLNHLDSISWKNPVHDYQNQSKKLLLGMIALGCFAYFGANYIGILPAAVIMIAPIVFFYKHIKNILLYNQFAKQKVILRQLSIPYLTFQLDDKKVKDYINGKQGDNRSFKKAIFTPQLYQEFISLCSAKRISIDAKLLESINPTKIEESFAKFKYEKMNSI